MTSLISSEYRKLNAELHKSNPSYGTSGQRYADAVRRMINDFGCESVLDYGCGKCTLAEALALPFVRNYDPAVPGLDSPPAPADLVVCTDVLEHIEPENLSAVLDHLAALTRKVCFLTVATRPAKKTLADGRNAHLIQHPSEWWLPALMRRWRLIQFTDRGGQEFYVVMVPKC